MKFFLPSVALFATTIASSTSAFTIQPSHPHSLPSSTSLHAQKRGRPRGPVRQIEIKPTMNNEIKYDKLRVTVPNLSPQSDGKSQPKDEPLGILTLVEALAKAKELGGLDVILINENSDPPVAKIVDYSKFRYEKEKKAKELKKNSKASELKEVKMSYKIDVHDYGVRIKSASKFVKQGNRVKCTVQFKGREQQHDRLGYELLNRMAEDMVKICSMEGRPKREGRFLSCIMSPRPEVTKAVNDKKRADEKAKKKNRQARKQAEKLEKSGGEVEPVKAAGGAAGMESIDDDEEGDLGELDDLLGSTGNDDLF